MISSHGKRARRDFQMHTCVFINGYKDQLHYCLKYKILVYCCVSKPTARWGLGSFAWSLGMSSCMRWYCFFIIIYFLFFLNEQIQNVRREYAFKMSRAAGMGSFSQHAPRDTMYVCVGMFLYLSGEQMSSQGNLTAATMHKERDFFFFSILSFKN